MQAEERYGRGGFRCTSTGSPRHMGMAHKRCTDIGSGQYEPLYAPAGGPPAPGVNYGATGGAYVR